MPQKKKSKIDVYQWFNNFTWSRHLLSSTPRELKDHISGARKNHESILEFFLTELENEARRTLKSDLPFGLTEQFDFSDFWHASREPEEYGLTEKQENAIAVIMGVFSLRDLLSGLAEKKRFWELKKTGSGVLKKIADLEDSESLEDLGEQIALGTIMLALAITRGDFWSNLWPRVKHGAAFREGPKYDRRDALAGEIERTLKNQGIKTSAKEIWAYLEKSATNHRSQVIQEITDDRIYWIDRKGNEKDTSYHDFEKRVSRLRKDLSQK